MPLENEQPLEPEELASLPAGDAERQAFAEKLRSGPSEVRDMWGDQWALSDDLRQRLAAVERPGGYSQLEERLLAVTDRQVASNSSPRHHFLLRPTWLHAAACVLIAAMVALYFLWPSRPTAPARLDPSLSHTIATWAVQNHETSPALEIESADAALVQKALAAHSLDFPVMMLKPSDGAELRGGGFCKLGAAQAAFTRWEAKGDTYTLYEFNGQDVGVPSDFLSASESPKELWHGDYQYRVIVWPGPAGKCCWALVIEKQASKNIFSSSQYRT